MPAPKYIYLKIMEYRREIDGLRALAVLPVILFHAGFETFRGGFVGVDVFFVISGYLITTIILAELEQGKFSIINFYERRARRILPALFLVMLACIPFACFWLLPSDMKDFSKSLVAVSVFVSNILFLRESGYFDTVAELKPLLHTWSLAVEEQYYVIFPLFLMLFWKLGKRWILVSLGLVFVSSLALAQWAAFAKPAAAFYLLPTRGWELLIGAFAAFYLSQTNFKDFGKGISEFGGWLGVALILYAVFTYSKATPFPGLYALVPTIGSVLIILLATQQTTVGNFVGNKAFVRIGLISYSAYLWHQPLFAFARQISLTEPSNGIYLILSISSFVLAYFTWRYVEAPFRRRENFNRKSIFKLSLIFTVFFASLGFFGHLGWVGARTSLSEDFINKFSGHKLRASCDEGIDQKSGEAPFCRLGNNGGSKPLFAVFGDSHSDAINPVFDKLGKNLGFSYVHSGLGGCLPLLGIDVVKGNWNKGICHSLAEKQFKYIKDNDIKKVFLVGRWSLYTQGDYGKEMTRYFLSRSESTELSRQSSRNNFREAFFETLLKYEEIGVNVVVVLQIPQQKSDPKKIYLKLLTSAKQDSNELFEFLRTSSVNFTEHLALQKFNRSFFESVKGIGNVKLFNPDPYFCDDSRCIFGTISSPYYRDEDHVTSAGSFVLEEGLLEFLK